jgi:hypothetical protein
MVTDEVLRAVGNAICRMVAFSPNMNDGKASSSVTSPWNGFCKE